MHTLQNAAVLTTLFLCVGDYDHLPEQAFYMVGPIEEAVAKADKLAEEHGS